MRLCIIEYTKMKLFKKSSNKTQQNDVSEEPRDSQGYSLAAKKSVKWSLFGEIFAKLAIPISTMILARLLTPEIYGITTAVTIVVTFCEMVTESGFSKFLIQHDFSSNEEFKKYFSVSFISSLFLSFLMILLVFIFKTPLSHAVGNDGYEMVLFVSCLQIPIASLNALYSAVLKRNFKFKNIFQIKVVYSLVPFIVTVPLAFLGMRHWSLVIGSIAAQIIQLPLLMLFSKNNFKIYFSFTYLKNAFIYAAPMILESIVIWLCSWTSTIIAARYFDLSTVGIIKVSNSTINSIFLLFSTAFTSVLFPALSRLKHDKKEYQKSFISIQSAALAILIPLGIGVYFYSKTVSSIFLGSQWVQAAFVIGIFSLTKPLMICFNNFQSEVFRSNGHFYSSIIYQLAMLFIDVTLKFTIGKISYNWFIWTTVISDLLITIISLGILRFKYKFSFVAELKALFIPFCCSAIMAPLAFFGSNSNSNIVISISQALVCASLYFIVLSLLFPKTVRNVFSFFKRG